MANGLESFGLALVIDGLPQYEQAATRVSKVTAELGHQAESAAAQTQELGAAATQVGFALAGLGAAGLAMARGFVMTAARAEELDVVLDRVAMGAGVTTSVVEEQREAIKALGITHSAANQILMRLVQSNIDLGNATKIARAAQDLAVIGMKDSSATALDLAYAIASGNVVILRKYGIMLNLKTMLGSVGSEEEKLTGKVNVQARSQLVMNALLQQAERVSGSYTAAMGTASKQLRSMARYTEEIARTFGESLLPILSKVVEMQTRFSKLLLALPPEIKMVISVALALGSALAAVAGAAILLVPRMDQWMAVLRALPGILAGLPGAFASFLISPMGLVAAAAAAMGAAVIFNIGGMQDAFVSAVRTAKSTLGLMGTVVQEAGRVMVSAWQEASQRSNAVLRDAGEEWAFHLREAGHEAEAVGGDISRRNFGIEFDPYRFAEGAAQLMAAFASGLLDGLNRYVIPTITGVVQAVANFLLGMSPPKVGPLSEVIAGGAEVIRQWLLGMSETSLKGVADIAEEVTKALQIPAFEASDVLRGLRAMGRSLDDAIRPIEENFRRIQAAATMIVYPLREQQRLLDLEIANLEEIVRGEDERATARTKALTDQIRLMDEMQSLDQARMRDLDREIAIEERRAAGGDQSARERVRKLKAQRMEMASALAVQEEQRRELKLQVQAEADAAKETTSEARKELTFRELRRRELESAVAAEQMMVTIAREQLDLAHALQVEDRITLEQQVDAWRRRQAELQHFGSLASDVLARYREELAEAESTAAGAASAAAAKGAKEAKESLAGLGASAADVAGQIGEKLGDALDLDPKLEAFKERMAGIFAPVAIKIAELRENLNKLGASFESLLEGVKERLGPIGKLLEGLFVGLDWNKVAYGLGLVAAGLVAIIALKVGLAALGVVWGLITSPIILIVAALGLLYVAWKKNLFGVRDFISELWERIDWKRVSQIIQEAWLAIGQAIKGIDWARIQKIVIEVVRNLAKAWNRIDWKQLGKIADQAIGGIVRAFQGLLQIFTARLPEAIALLKRTWELFAPVLQTTSEVLLPSLRQAFDQISAAIRDNLGPLLDSLRSAAQAILPALSAVAAILGVVLVGAISVVVSAISGLVSGISTAIPFVIETIMAVVDVLAGVFELIASTGAAMLALVQGDTIALAAAWGRMKASIIETVASLGRVVQGLFRTFSALVIGTVTKFVRSIIKFWKTLSKKLVGRSIIPDLVSKIESLFTKLRDFLIKLFKRLRDKAVEIWTSLKEKVVDVVVSLWEKLVEWFEKIRLAVIEKWDAILAKTREIWDALLVSVSEKVEAMLAVITETMTAVWDKIRTTFDDIKTKIFDRMGDIQSKIRATFDDIKSKVFDRMSDIWSKIRTTFDDIKSKVFDRMDEVFTKITTIWTGIKTAVAAELDEIVTLIGTWFSDIATTLAEIDIKQAGSDIFQSLWDGLIEKAEEIFDWIKEQAQKWLDAIKDIFFFIGDPYSQAFMHVGEGMMEGLRRGLASMEPQVQQQLIASMPSPQMVPLPTPSSSATRIYNITRGGPSIELTAHYAHEQSEASIRDDVSMMLALA